MKELSGKVAVISGGAEGIGLAIARVLGEKGMKLVLGDIDAQQLERARDELEGSGVDVLAMPLDVANPDQWQLLADATLERFGKIHLLVNNAGVGGSPRPISNSSTSDWRWIVDVNLMGVVFGAQAITPHIQSHGEGGWVVNVASMAGFIPLPMASAYSATKAAVVAMSESWRVELEPAGIGVSVLCPGFVKTRINQSHRNRPSSQAPADANPVDPAFQKAMNAQMQAVIDAGAPPELIARRVVEAIADRELYIVTHPNFLPAVEKRFGEIGNAFRRAQSSELLQDIMNEPIPGFDSKH